MGWRCSKYQLGERSSKGYETPGVSPWEIHIVNILMKIENLNLERPRELKPQSNFIKFVAIFGFILVIVIVIVAVLYFKSSNNNRASTINEISIDSTRTSNSSNIFTPPSCTYTSSSTGVPHEISFDRFYKEEEITAESCKRHCINSRDILFSRADSGICEYKGTGETDHTVMKIVGEKIATSTHKNTGSIDPNTLKSLYDVGIIKGTAMGLTDVNFDISGLGAGIMYQSGLITIVNNNWIHKVSKSVYYGDYSGYVITLSDQDGYILDSIMFTLGAKGASKPISCSRILQATTKGGAKSYQPVDC